MSKSAGTYEFGAFDRNEEELERLQRQATVVAEMEIKKLVQLGLKENMNVMDLACGPGLISCGMAGVVKPGRVLGVDLSPDLIAVAEKNREARGVENVSFTTGDVYNPNLTEETFDWRYARFLFQHLERPAEAIKNAHQFLKPGGTICITDVDDAWLGLYPDSGAFRSFAERAAEGQAKNGGDRYIGRKIGAYLHEAGYTNIRTVIQLVSSQERGSRNFLDLTTGFKLEQIPEDQRDEAALELKEIYSATEKEYIWGAVGVFVVLAERNA